MNDYEFWTPYRKYKANRINNKENSKKTFTETYLPKKNKLQIDLGRIFKYSPNTGKLIWISGTRMYTEAGSIKADGYRYVMLNSKTYRADELIYALRTGTIVPLVDGKIIHLNEKKDDNKISNLRYVKNN